MAQPRIRRGVQTLRCTIKQEARVVLEPEADAVNVNDPELGRCVRRVQVLVPAREGILFGIDVDPSECGIGPDRTYKLPVLTSGAQIEYTLLPEQWVIAAVDTGMSTLTLIVEYIWENA